MPDEALSYLKPLLGISPEDQYSMKAWRQRLHTTREVYTKEQPQKYILEVSQCVMKLPILLWQAGSLANTVLRSIAFAPSRDYVECCYDSGQA
jgi:hypothetical protein